MSGRDLFALGCAVFVVVVTVDACNPEDGQESYDPGYSNVECEAFRMDALDNNSSSSVDSSVQYEMYC